MSDDAPEIPVSPFEVPAGSPCLQGERVSFTGTLASMTHRQAHATVAEHGGVATSHVSQQTTMLIVGEEGWPLEPDGQPSQKLRQVTEWQQQGREIKLLNESEWLHLLGLEERSREVHRLYTPAMLSQLLNVPVGVIRSWERAGLITPVRKVCRLPYFDFQEVTSARRLVELLSAGVSQKEIESSLSSLRTVLGGIERPLAQLNILARDAHLFYRDSRGLVEPRSGQRLLDFDPPAASEQPGMEQLATAQSADGEADDRESVASSLRLPLSPAPDAPSSAQMHWTVDEWFREGCRLADQNELDSAVEAFRLCLMDRAGDPEVNFHLAETLYRMGNAAGALERYHAAVESDHDYLEAWTQLGCLHEEGGRLKSALDAFRIALEVHADYPDAHWHLADVLSQLGRTEEAVTHWQTYLKFDSRGPWAESARQRLGMKDEG